MRSYFLFLGLGIGSFFVIYSLLTTSVGICCLLVENVLLFVFSSQNCVVMEYAEMFCLSRLLLLFIYCFQNGFVMEPAKSAPPHLVAKVAVAAAKRFIENNCAHPNKHRVGLGRILLIKY